MLTEDCERETYVNKTVRVEITHQVTRQPRCCFGGRVAMLSATTSTWIR
jgi:hypothetical protein